MLADIQVECRPAPAAPEVIEVPPVGIERQAVLEEPGHILRRAACVHGARGCFCIGSAEPGETCNERIPIHPRARVHQDGPACLIGMAGEVADAADIAPGSGAVMREGMDQLAVYRDENSQLHRLSAVCPHLKCIVHWNPGEKTWDCPCHGSRFSATGKVVAGPAHHDLPRR